MFWEEGTCLEFMRHQGLWGHRGRACEQAGEEKEEGREVPGPDLVGPFKP